MNRRVPLVSVLPLALLLVGLLNVPSMLAADAPQLAASTIPGKEIDVSGTGFPANSPVQLVTERNGVPLVNGATGTEGSGTQSLHTDASGSFTATIPAGPGRGGRYTLTATAGTATATVVVVAVETAGGTVGGVKPTPPPTDTVTGRAPAPDPSRWILVALGLGLGLTGFGLATRAAQLRRGRTSR